MPHRKLIVLLTLCLVTSSCIQRDPLTRTFAANAISASATFKTNQQFFLRTGVMSNKDYMTPEYLVLQRRGWITGAPAACTQETAPPPCYDVALTPIGIETFRNLFPAEAKSTQYVPIATARRQLLSVTGISKADNRADVDFTWQWLPMNEVGAALVTTGITYQSTVGFRHYDDGWRLIDGSATRSNQSMDDALKNAQAQQ
jgi:hypothetical protein